MRSVPTTQKPLQRVFDYLAKGRQAKIEDIASKPKPAPNPSLDTLTQAIEQNDNVLVTQLLQSRLDINATDSMGRLPLVMALEKGQLSIARQMVDLGADPRHQDPRGKSALGALWLESVGGVGLQPENQSHHSGQASELLAQWQARFPVRDKNDIFSPSFREQHFPAATHARFELDPRIQSRGLGADQAPAANVQWDEMDSGISLALRQQQRRAKMIPPPNPDLGMGRLPKHSREPYAA